MTITAKELADLKAVMSDAVKFSADDVDGFNTRLLEAQDNYPGVVFTLSGSDSQLMRAALMCFMLRDELVRMAEEELKRP